MVWRSLSYALQATVYAVGPNGRTELVLSFDDPDVCQ
jgi:hypothetical protein